MLPFAESVYNWEWRFQKDDAPLNTSTATNEFFMGRAVLDMEWSESSTNFNPAGNIWGTPARLVYKDFWQFDTWKIFAKLLKLCVPYRL